MAVDCTVGDCVIVRSVDPVLSGGGVSLLGFPQVPGILACLWLMVLKGGEAAAGACIEFCWANNPMLKKTEQRKKQAAPNLVFIGV